MNALLTKVKFLTSLVTLIMSISGATAEAREDFSKHRSRMVDEIRAMVSETSGYIGKKSLDDAVMEAMGEVPRHEFVPRSLWNMAYENHPLPIGEDQTISQPYIVALMTDLAEVNGKSRVLEVGTGSGYQAAVLAELAGHVYTIEIIEELGVRARQTLERLGYENVTVKIGDGFHGWEEHAPFDAVLVTAAPEEVPRPLIDQLKPGGKLVIPVGRRYGVQYLKVLEKDESGGVHSRDVLPVGFVPLTGDH